MATLNNFSNSPPEPCKFSSYRKINLGKSTGRLNPSLPCPPIRTLNAVSETIRPQWLVSRPKAKLTKG